MKKPIVFACLLSLTAVPAFVVGPAAAEAGMGFAEETELFRDTDANHDGFVSQSELEFAGVTSDLESVDRSGDGKLDQSEFSALGSTGPIGGGVSGTAGDDLSGSGIGGGASAGGTESDGGSD